MHLFIWGHIFCNLGFFYTVLHFVWHFSLDQCYLCRSCKWASKDLVLVFMSFISTFYLLCDHLAAADQAKLLCPKKEEMLYEQRHSFLFRFSIWFEITFIILGCILESFINPSIMSGILNLLEVIYLGSYTFLYIICHAVKQSSRFVPSKTRISDRLSIYTVTDGLVAIFDITFDHDTLNKRFDLR